MLGDGDAAEVSLDQLEGLHVCPARGSETERATLPFSCARGVRTEL